MTNAQQDKLKALYASKILAVRNYESELADYKVGNFTDLKSFIEIMLQINENEADITPAGKAFLEDYGYEEVARLLIETNLNLFLPKKLAKKDKFAACLWWLEHLVPMQITTMVAEARGIEVSKTRLKEKLLPPLDR